MKFLIFVLMAIFSFSYDLTVLDKKDSEILKNIGFNCVKKNTIFVCFSSNNINELKRVQDFLKVKFNVNTFILNENNSLKNKSSKKRPKIHYTKNNHKYCIQISSFKDLKIGKKQFNTYRKFPFTRIEKIGEFYTLRVGEGSYKNIKNLEREVGGLLRRCDINPNNIVMSNFNIKNYNTLINFVKSSPSNNNALKLKKMYKYLNSGDLIQAKKTALELKAIYPNDSKLVLGLVDMKQGNFEKACNIFSSLKTKKGYKLKKDACYTYYVKTGFNLVNLSPKKAIYYFSQALYIKPNSKDALLGEGYAYTNLKDYKKSYNIFKNLYKKYPNDTKILKGYINVLYLSKKFDELNKLQSSLPDNLKSEISSINFYIKLKKAQKLINKKQYAQAENILTNLYIEKPDDVNLLLSLANLYLQTNQLDKSLNYFNNVLIISPDNIYALRGIEVIYMKKGDYEKALRYSNRIIALGFKDENQKNIKKFYYINLAKKALKENNINQAKIYLNKAYNLDKNNALILALLGDVAFKENNNNLAYKYYVKAYKIGKNNFGIKLKFLYALLKLNLFDQIKIILSTIDGASLNEYQKMLLKDFYINLYNKYATYLLNNKEYKKALAIINNALLMDENNYNLLSTKAWICLKLKKYECAKNYFQLALKQKNDNNLKYGLALTFLNEGDKSSAKKILDSIYTDDKDLIIKIADAYIRIGEIKKAKNLLKQINTTSSVFPNPFLKNNYADNNTNIFIANPKIDELYDVKKKLPTKDSTLKEYESIQKEISKIEQNYINNVKFGFKLRNKSGGKGTSKLTRISFPYLRGEYFIDTSKKITFTLDGESLDSGKSKDVENDLQTKVSGIGVKIGFETNNFKTHFGITPSNTKLVSPALIGDISGKIKKNQNTFYLKFYRDSLKNTLTSYVGNEKNGTKFSRVLKNGIKLGYKKDLDVNGSFVYTDINFNYLTGKNINSNNNFEGECLYLNYIGDTFLDRNFLGFYMNVGHYDKNQAFYTPPYGGYFSPNLFLLVMPRYEGYLYLDNKKFISKLTLMAGGSYIDNWNSSGNNFAYDISYSFKYLFIKNLAIESGFDFRNSKDYSDIFFTLAFRYYFGNKLFFTNKDIDEFSDRIINW